MSATAPSAAHQSEPVAHLHPRFCQRSSSSISHNVQGQDFHSTSTLDLCDDPYASTRSNLRSPTNSPAAGCVRTTLRKGSSTDLRKTPRT
ncbi:hypothetical protein MJO28_000338 [Puccinia striiformis f. sp. tritici]|uniref:Uncharacterized protein n=1 Tax=Puccinia striiformis f. sp. tritici TaxID=168172 RepID=A0ACC0EYV3_9BASI|nr:hypothetical protein MJO28_000338 [Puccinia striiformis f. sp. tritici]